jgi:hypothetical protein
MLEMNQYFLTRAYGNQNDCNYEESIKCLEKIYKNFHTLGMMVDQIPLTPFIIRENREILSQAHLEQNKDYFPVKMNNNYEFEKSQFKNLEKKKQQKTKWSEEEQRLFLEGLELYGYKSKNY